LGKPYASEVKSLPKTYRFASRAPLETLIRVVKGAAAGPLVAVGSGGSLSAAHFAATLHQSACGKMAKAMTPLESSAFTFTDGEITFLLLSAGARAASSIELSAFGSCLQDALDGAEWQPAFESALQAIPARIREKAGKKALFAEWISAREAVEGTPRERAISWRALEILIERELRRTQSTFDFSLGVEDLEHKDDSSLKAAAELFLAREYELPYYFGSSTLSKLATSNIEQFLWLAGEEFEEVVSAAVISPTHVADLTPARQEAIIKKAAKSLWDEIPRRAANGRNVRRFLECIAAFSRWYTFQPSAPNDPGVNGIAISMTDREKLLNPTYLGKHPEHAIIAEVVAIALAHNLIDADLDYKCKGERWMVLNLNRLLCVSYSLPLNYGKFKEKTLAELSKWISSGYVPPKGTGTSAFL
jgi:hypothetical protein